MKKVVIILILFIACLLVGCNSPKETEGKFEFDTEITGISIYKEANYMFNSEYQVLLFVSSEDIDDIKEELNAVKFKQIKTYSIDKKETYDYIIKLSDDYVIYIIEDKEFFIYYKGEYNKCRAIEGSFNVFDLYYFGEKMEVVDKNIKFKDITYMSVKYNDVLVNVTSNNYIKNLFVETVFYKKDDSLTKDQLMYQVVVNNTNYDIYYNGLVLEEDDTDREPREYFVKVNLLDDFKELVTGEQKCFNFETVTKIQVTNKDNKAKEIAEKEDFVNKIKDIKYYKVKTTKNFILGELSYKINIDGIIISVYKNDLIIYGDDVCVVTEGNFDFLNDIKFGGSSGWLPWV